MLDTNANIMAVRLPDWPICKKVGDFNMLITDHVRLLGYTLITNNVREFSHLKVLLYEQWKKWGIKDM